MTPSDPVRLAVVGTSPIGRMHTDVVAANPNADLVGLSSLDDDAPKLAEKLQVPLHTDFRRLVDLGLDGIVIATPNQLHLEMGAFFAERGIHVLVEKPIADTVAAGKELCAVAARHGVHLLVGHHRRYNNLVLSAADLVAAELGRLVATNTMAIVRKPDSYYRESWRRSAGAGPLLVNLVHDLDLLRAVCGEIDSVQAAATRRARSFEVDDTAAVLVRYHNGAFGTVVMSDSAPSPWSWEASVSEGLGLPTAGRDHAHFTGTEASLGFPSMTLWSYDPAEGEPGWNLPLRRRSIEVERNNPYYDQVSHFAAVIRGMASPRVSGVDGLRSLAVVAAVIEAARTGDVVEIDQVLDSAG